MALIVFDGFTLPDEQAEPAETMTPTRSRVINCCGLSQPSTAMNRVLGRRGAAPPMMVAPAALTLASAASRQAACARAASRSRAAQSAAAPNPVMPGTFSVPARRPRS
ncbi:hypothetical protein D3C71_711820 [compost metagenome]